MVFSRWLDFSYLSLPIGFDPDRFSRDRSRGIGLMEYGKFLFLPFSYDMVRKKNNPSGGALRKSYHAYATIVKVVYILLFGIWLYIVGLVAVIAQFVTIIGIPGAIVPAKSLHTIFNPMDKICIRRNKEPDVELPWKNLYG